MKAKDYSVVANSLWQAEKTGVPIAPISEGQTWNVSDAYLIQQRFVELKRGSADRVVGRKIGLTSVAMQKLLGVPEPDWGTLLESMNCSQQRPCLLSKLIQPKIEPEITFRLKKDLRGPSVSVLDALAAIDLAYPSLEIVDSRIADWKIKIMDTIADNASSAMFVIGDRGWSAVDLDLVSLGVVFEKNGELISTGTGIAVMGHPAAPVAWLANTLSKFGEYLRSGELVMSGGMVAAINVAAGDRFRARFGEIGEVEVTFSK
jgi:2-keto-4-pentenoate hydratase